MGTPVASSRFVHVMHIPFSVDVYDAMCCLRLLATGQPLKLGKALWCTNAQGEPKGTQPFYGALGWLQLIRTRQQPDWTGVLRICRK